MLGLVVGTVGVLGLIHLLRHRRRFGRAYGGCGYGGGYHYDDYDVRGRGGWRGFGGPRAWLRWIFEHIHVTPAQEKIIRSALEDLRRSRAAVRDESERTRADLARSFSSGLVDDSAFEDMFARHDRLLAELRVSFAEGLKKILESLDETQRKELARILEGGGAGRLFGGGFQSVWV